MSSLVYFREINPGEKFVKNGLIYIRIDTITLESRSNYYDEETEEESSGPWYPNSFCIGVNNKSYDYIAEVAEFNDDEKVRRYDDTIRNT